MIKISLLICLISSPVLAYSESPFIPKNKASSISAIAPNVQAVPEVVGVEYTAYAITANDGKKPRVYLNDFWVFEGQLIPGTQVRVSKIERIRVKLSNGRTLQVGQSINLQIK